MEKGGGIRRQPAPTCGRDRRTTTKYESSLSSRSDPAKYLWEYFRNNEWVRIGLSWTLGRSLSKADSGRPFGVHGGHGICAVHGYLEIREIHKILQSMFLNCSIQWLSQGQNYVLIFTAVVTVTQFTVSPMHMA